MSSTSVSRSPSKSATITSRLDRAACGKPESSSVMDCQVPSPLLLSSSHDAPSSLTTSTSRSPSWSASKSAPSTDVASTPTSNRSSCSKTPPPLPSQSWLAPLRRRTMSNSPSALTSPHKEASIPVTCANGTVPFGLASISLSPPDADQLYRRLDCSVDIRTSDSPSPIQPIPR